MLNLFKIGIADVKQKTKTNQFWRNEKQGKLF